MSFLANHHHDAALTLDTLPICGDIIFIDSISSAHCNLDYPVLLLAPPGSPAHSPVPVLSTTFDNRKKRELSRVKLYHAGETRLKHFSSCRNYDVIRKCIRGCVATRMTCTGSLMFFMFVLSLCAGDAGPTGRHCLEGLPASWEDWTHWPNCDHMIPLPSLTLIQDFPWMLSWLQFPTLLETEMDGKTETQPAVWLQENTRGALDVP